MNISTSSSIWPFGVFCGLLGALVAAVLAGCWYSPLVFSSPHYGELLTTLSNIFWPTARIIGGWVGFDDPVRYWLLVSGSVIANAVVYGCVGAIGITLAQRLRALSIDQVLLSAVDLQLMAKLCDSAPFHLHRRHR